MAEKNKASMKTIFFALCFAGLACVVLVHFVFPIGTNIAFRDNRNYKRSAHDVIEFIQKLKRQACVHPKLDVNDPIMIAILKKHDPVTCPGQGRDWVYVTNGTLRFSEHILKKNISFSCDYHPLLRTPGDSSFSFGKPVVNISKGFPIPTDFFKIYCRNAENETFEDVMAGVSLKKDRFERKLDPLASGFGGMSIVIFGLDSMSHMSWLRRLPKTREYFVKQLGALELEEHNIVGDGTTAVMFPMLTGKFEWELPECRRGYKGATTMDNFTWLWRDFQKAGYLTSWANAMPTTAPFNYRMLGFEEQPTDFYIRPYMLAQHKGKKLKNLCAGSKPLATVWLKWVKDIFLMYKTQRKFLFHFVTDFSHDDVNLVTMLDEELRATVQFLHDGGYLDNTLFILMGDHGARYGKYRQTFTGKLEERMPYFSLLFPKWFQSKYPKAMVNLRNNAHRLTTPFDIHETFKDFLHFRGEGDGNIKDRGISLFREIPLARTCEHADIAPHWCACLEYTAVEKTDAVYSKVLSTAVTSLNDFTKDYRKECAFLKLLNVSSVYKYKTRNEFLKFTQTDPDGGYTKIGFMKEIPSYEDETLFYLTTFFTSPGEGEYEVTVTHDVRQKVFSVESHSISRINLYGNAPKCVLDKNREIRQFCYCKNLLHASSKNRTGYNNTNTKINF